MSPPRPRGIPQGMSHRPPALSTPRDDSRASSRNLTSCSGTRAAAKSARLANRPLDGKQEKVGSAARVAHASALICCALPPRRQARPARSATHSAPLERNSCNPGRFHCRPSRSRRARVPCACHHLYPIRDSVPFRRCALRCALRRSVRARCSPVARGGMKRRVRRHAGASPSRSLTLVGTRATIAWTAAGRHGVKALTCHRCRAIPARASFTHRATPRRCVCVTALTRACSNRLLARGLQARGCRGAANYPRPSRCPTPIRGRRHFPQRPPRATRLLSRRPGASAPRRWLTACRSSSVECPTPSSWRPRSRRRGRARPASQSHAFPAPSCRWAPCPPSRRLLMHRSRRGPGTRRRTARPL